MQQGYANAGLPVPTRAECKQIFTDYNRNTKSTALPTPRRGTPRKRTVTRQQRRPIKVATSSSGPRIKRASSDSGGSDDGGEGGGDPAPAGGRLHARPTPYLQIVFEQDGRSNAAAGGNGPSDNALIRAFGDCPRWITWHLQGEQKVPHVAKGADLSKPFATFTQAQQSSAANPNFRIGLELVFRLSISDQ
jgi:hypothetical protein